MYFIQQISKPKPVGLDPKRKLRIDTQTMSVMFNCCVQYASGVSVNRKQSRGFALRHWPKQFQLCVVVVVFCFFCFVLFCCFFYKKIVLSVLSILVMKRITPFE